MAKKLRHKRMARAAFRSCWHYREWWSDRVSAWIGPFAKWHLNFRSIKP